MKIFSWNVNGLRAVVKKGFFEWLKLEAPDVVCLQEIKARVEDLDENLLNPKGYHTAWNPAERKGYSGVAVFMKKKPAVIHRGMGIERFDSEGRIIRVEFKDFDLLNVYFPNGTSGSERLQYKMDFYDAFLEHCEDLRSKGRELVITGDVNTAHKPIDLKIQRQMKRTQVFYLKNGSGSISLLSMDMLTVFELLISNPINIPGGAIVLTCVQRILAGV